MIEQGKRPLIIVPYRDRAEHLSIFLKVFQGSPILVVEQAEGNPFNKGKLYNAGFVESPDYDYYILHDVDMIPVYADYSYPDVPTHLATHCSQFDYEMPYEDYFGGVVLVSKEDYAKANGFPNEFWGWGGEDGEFRRRLLHAGLSLKSRDCRFECLGHSREIDPILLYENRKRQRAPLDVYDGLNSLKYRVLKDEMLSDTCRKLTLFV